MVVGSPIAAFLPRLGRKRILKKHKRRYCVDGYQICFSSVKQ